jgi:hypothetical protein
MQRRVRISRYDPVHEVEEFDASALTGHSHEYKRNGTITSFAAFEVTTGKFIDFHSHRRGPPGLRALTLQPSCRLFVQLREDLLQQGRRGDARARLGRHSRQGRSTL